MTQDAGMTFDAFPFQTYDKLRYADTDRQGHVNNAVFSTFLESGRVGFLYNADEPLLEAGCSFVIARLALDFILEITWPGTVEIGTGVIRVGSSSLTLRQDIFQNGRCAARAETVIVQVSDSTKRSHPLTQKTRDFLNAALLK